MDLANSQPIPILIPDMRLEGVQSNERHSRLSNIKDIGMAAVSGAVMGPFRQLREIASEVKQARNDYRTISRLVREQDSANTNITSETNKNRATIRDRVGFAALKAWYLAPLPAYQIADDTITYPIYLAAQQNLGAGAGYGIAAGCTLALAIAMGHGQRVAEKKKANLLRTDTTADKSEILPALLDSSVNSAPWEVVRKANEPRQDGEPIQLVGLRRIVAYAAAYGVVNTSLYAMAESLPVNEWVGFGGMLVGVWAVGGAYRSVRELTSIRSEESVS